MERDRTATGDADPPSPPGGPRRPAPEAASAREEALSLVAHDLRNPLAALLLGVQRLERLVDGPERAQVEALVEKLEHTIRQASRHVERLADLARLEAGRLELHPEAEAPAEVVARALEPLEPLAAERGQRLEVDVEPGLPAPPWDGARVAQALGELATNAIRHTREGGAVRVAVRRVPGGVRFAVRDDGPGLAAEALEHVFDPLWRPSAERRSGPGVGLSLARALVEAHGGAMEAESEAGGGATFSFTLPAPAGVAASPAAPGGPP